MTEMASTHFQDGHPTMVDVSDKDVTHRLAVATATVTLPSEALSALEQGHPKGDPIAVAELAGIMAAKKTSELIPLCHPLPLTSAEVVGERTDHGVRFVATCKTNGSTGVEMEALTAASVAGLTLYDMLKSAAKGIEITDVVLLEKRGGRSGTWRRG